MATIAENLQTILDIKNDIKSAIIAKGVSVADTDGFATYPSKIESIESGGTLETINITENGVYVPSEGVDGYNQVNVNVTTPSQSWKIVDGINFRYSTITTYPYSIDCENCTNIKNLFYENSNLTNVNLINTSNVSDMTSLFQRCGNLTSVENIDMSSVTNMGSICWQCSKLQSFKGDTNKVTNFSGAFHQCSSLESVDIDMTSATNLNGMFCQCDKLKITEPFDISNVTNIGGAFYGTSTEIVPFYNTDNVTNAGITQGDSYKGVLGSTKIKTIDKLQFLNATTTQAMFGNSVYIENVNELIFPSSTNISYLFYYCSKLKSVNKIEGSNFKNLSYSFFNCNALESLCEIDATNATNVGYIFGSSDNTTLTNFGGFKNLKINWSDNYGLYRLPNLTYESVMNVINNLYDFRSNGDTSTTRTIKFNANSKALLSESDIAVATAKGWIIS